MVKRFARSSGLAGLVFSLLTVPAVRAAEKEPGVLWESTVSLKMQQFSMPPTTAQFCAPKEGLQEPPTPEDQGHCKVKDLKRSGGKMTWKIECTGEDALSGEGELVQGKDRYEGKMTMRSPTHGEMLMTLSGRRMNKDCDAGALKREVAALQKQQEELQAKQAEGQAQMCEKAVEEMQVQLFAGPMVLCKDKAQVAKLCARAATRPGFLALQEQGDGVEPLKAAGELCKLDMQKTQARLCAAAAADATAGGSAPPADALRLLPRSCPSESRVLAKKECAGRSYTGTPGTWRGFCAEYARLGLSAGQGENVQPASTDAEDPKSIQDKAIDKAKKSILKGLLGG